MPYEWLEVLRCLDILAPGEQVSEKVICNHILDFWWGLRFRLRKGPIYLPFTEVLQLSRDVVNGVAQPSQTFEGGVFQSLYHSIIPNDKDRRVCFFLHRSQPALSMGHIDSLREPNHYFPVLFDYRAHRAYAFGILSVSEPGVVVRNGTQSNWDLWQGPELWEMIGSALGWVGDIGKLATVNVVTKSWPQVCLPQTPARYQILIPVSGRRRMTVESTLW